MAEVKPLRALHFNLESTGGLQEVIAPPYDVIDPEQRARLAARSPHNVVRIDLPQGDDPYAAAAEQLANWRRERVIVQDDQPALWVLEQEYTGPDRQRRTRHGFLARVRVEEYGARRIRPHERTHPGPREDRLRLTRATRANLSPIFALFSDPEGNVWRALAPATAARPWGRAVDEDGTENRLWRLGDPAAIETVASALRDAELLIADGHHRYETARAYAEEVGGEGPHRHFTSEPLDDVEQLVPPADPEVVRIGYLDARERRPRLLTLRDQAAVDAALAGRSSAYRRLDTAVLEALILKGALGMSDEDIDHLRQLGYARDREQAVELLAAGDYEAAFLMAPVPVERVREIAAAGESMPPKSTYFFPKVPTGLLFNSLVEPA